MNLAIIVFIDSGVAPQAICTGFCVYMHNQSVLNGWCVMPVDLSATEGISAEDQSWPWWPLLPLSDLLRKQVWGVCLSVVHRFLCNWAELWGHSWLAISSVQCWDTTEPQHCLKLSIFDDVRAEVLRPDVISLEGMDLCRNDVDG